MRKKCKSLPNLNCNFDKSAIRHLGAYSRNNSLSSGEAMANDIIRNHRHSRPDVTLPMRNPQIGTQYYRAIV